MRTSLYSILCIGIRLAAVLLAVNTLLSVPAGYAALVHGDWGRSEIVWLAVLWTVVLLFALLLWVYPGMLARLAAGKASQEIFESPVGAEELQYIAFSIVGLWILLGGVIGFAQSALSELFVDHVLRSSNAGIDAQALRVRAIMDFATEVLRILVGGALMLRARGLVALLRRARYAGLSQTVGDDEATAEEDRKS
jgi:hypothetical protein